MRCEKGYRVKTKVPLGSWVHSLTASLVFTCMKPIYAEATNWTHPMCWRVAISCTDRSASAGSTPTATPGLWVDPGRRHSQSSFHGVSLVLTRALGLDQCCYGGPWSILCLLENEGKASPFLLSSHLHIRVDWDEILIVLGPQHNKQDAAVAQSGNKTTMHDKTAGSDRRSESLGMSCSTIRRDMQQSSGWILYIILP